MARIVMTSIEDLIQACVDDGRLLARAGDIVSGDGGRALTQLARERDRFVDELQGVGTTLRGRPRARASWGGRARLLATQAWAFAAGPNGGDAVAACRRSRDHVEALLTRALESRWTRDVEATLVEQLASIHRAQGLLVGLQYPAAK